jgi:hypothetical protein
MSVGGLVFFILLLAAVLLLVVMPLLRPRLRANPDSRLERQRDRLLSYYERVLTNLRDLDEDHATAKIDAADYNSEREIWIRRGIEALKAIDSLQENSMIPDGDDATIDEAIDVAIESAVAAYRQT